MAKWQSKAEIEEQQYRQWYRQVYPDLKAAIDAYIATYDWNQPVADDMKTLANSPSALLGRRLAKECVWPFVRATGASLSFQSNIVGESIDIAVKPFRDASLAKARMEQQARREALKTRPVVEEGMYRQSSQVGEFVMFPKQGRVLICISSEYVRADEDMGQFENGYYEKFAKPNEAEQGTPEYQRAYNTMQTEIAQEARARADFEARRKAELDAIKAEGREPNFFEDIFAGTSEN